MLQSGSRSRRVGCRTAEDICVRVGPSTTSALWTQMLWEQWWVALDSFTQNTYITYVYIPVTHRGWCTLYNLIHGIWVYNIKVFGIVLFDSFPTPISLTFQGKKDTVHNICVQVFYLLIFQFYMYDITFNLLKSLTIALVEACLQWCRGGTGWNIYYRDATVWPKQTAPLETGGRCALQAQNYCFMPIQVPASVDLLIWAFSVWRKRRSQLDL